MAKPPAYVYLQPVAVLATSEPDTTSAFVAPATGSHIKRLDSSVPVPPAEMVPWNQVLRKTFSNTPVIWQTQLDKEYQDLGDALTQMTELEDESEWVIERPVYDAACFVAAGLMASSFPAPRLFNHGPKSVVFNWTDDNKNNLYLTVSADRISALVSSPERIKKRLDYSAKELLNYRNLLGSLRSAQLEQPVLMLASGTSDPSESDD
jgi:hypothetical protein